MPGLVPGIHVLIVGRAKDVDGRDKPGHDVGNFLLISATKPQPAPGPEW
jgi:hypothetical protein